MKYWAEERAKSDWDPFRKQRIPRLLIKPLQLRGVMIGNNGWANQK
jgi:hypothetical protein